MLWISNCLQLFDFGTGWLEFGYEVIAVDETADVGGWVGERLEELGVGGAAVVGVEVVVVHHVIVF